MKRNIFKTMTAAAALLTLVSCADDLDLSSGKLSSGKGDLTAALPGDGSFTRLGMNEGTANSKYNTWEWVFTQGDQIRVFSLNQMSYDYYELTGGANTSDGEFTLKGQKNKVLGEDEKYALTDAQFVYAVSPDAQGKPWLTYTIPYQYSARTVTQGSGDNAINVQKFPAPFWGVASEDTQTNPGKTLLDVSLKALTGFLRIEMETLPDDTKYIVLTTHGSISKDENGETGYDGFQLVSPDPNGSSKVQLADGTLKDFTDTNAWWEENVEYITDGNSEPLSGSFTCELKDKTSKLAVDKGLANSDGDNYASYGISRLVTRDEIVIDVTKFSNNGVFWVPLIAQHYNNLHVLAVQKMSKYTYRYIGTELKTYVDKAVGVNDKLLLTMNMENLGKVCPFQLNQAIKAINKANKHGIPNVNNILNVDKLTTCQELGHYLLYVGGTTNKWYHYDGNRVEFDVPNDEILVQGDGNLVLNLKEVTQDACSDAFSQFPSSPSTTTQYSYGGSAVRSDAINGVEKVLLVSDLNTTNRIKSSNTYVPKFDKSRSYTSFTGDRSNNVTINMPYNWVETADDAASHALLSDLPLYNVWFQANNNYAPYEYAEFLRIDAHGASTKFVTGHNVLEVDEEGKVSVKDEKGAAINVVNGIMTLNILKDTKGDVFVYDGNSTKVEINDAMNVYTSEGLNIRLTNSLVNNMNFLAQSRVNNQKRTNWVFTTGSSAIAKVGVIGQQDANPDDVTLQSYWTKYALDSEQRNIKNYDTGTIYTVAQLASMGEEIEGSETNKYIIDPLVTDMWLGGEKYGWIGAAVTIDGFEFNGNTKSLKNMTLIKSQILSEYGNNNYRVVYDYDPHICCTTCGWNRPTTTTNEYDDPAGTDKFTVTEFGLIRTINNSDAATIKNVRLNDVYVGDVEINNVGSLVGKAETPLMTFENNKVGEVQLKVKGSKVGGIAGEVQATDITVNENHVANSYGSDNSGIIYGTQYVGGLIGLAQATNANSISITNSSVDLANQIEATTQSYAGGFIGKAKAAEAILVSESSAKAKNILAKTQYAGGIFGDANAQNINIETTSVETAENIRATTGYAGGLIGNAVASADVNLLSDAVKAQNIQATNGNFAGGLIGKAVASNDVNLLSNAVKAKNIQATNGYYAGGYVGKEEAANVLIKDASVEVSGNILAGQQYAGGLIGMNDAAQTDITDGDITVNTIQATEGFAGGEIGIVNSGKVNVGQCIAELRDYKVQLETFIDIENMKGAYALGGIIGNNVNNSEVNIWTGRQNENATGDPKWYSKIYVDVNAFANTKSDLKAFFTPTGSDSKAELAGSVSNILGLLDGSLAINETYLYVNDHLDSKMKEANGYKYHPDQMPTPGATVRYFWGDYNGYVGTGKSGLYWVSVWNSDVKDKNPLKAVDDDQNKQNGFNLYKLDSDYSATSKNYDNPWPTAEVEGGEDL